MRKIKVMSVLCTVILLCNMAAYAVAVPNVLDFEDTSYLNFSTAMIIVGGDWGWESKQIAYDRCLSFVDNIEGKASDDTVAKISVSDDLLQGLGLNGNKNEVRLYMDVKEPLYEQGHEWVVSYQVMISDYTSEVKVLTAGYHFGTFKSDGKIYGGAAADKEIGTWEKYKWYTVTVVLNAGAAEGDFYINNVKVDGKVGIRSEETQAGVMATDIHIYTTKSGTVVNSCDVYIDNLYFEDLGKGSGLFKQPETEIPNKVEKFGGKVVENSDGTRTVYHPNRCETAGAYLTRLGVGAKLYSADDSHAIAENEFVGGRATLTETLKYGITETYKFLPYIHMADIQHRENTGEIAVTMKNDGEFPADGLLIMAAYKNGLLCAWDRQNVTAEGSGREQVINFNAGSVADEINIWMVDNMVQTTSQLCSWVYKKGQ